MTSAHKPIFLVVSQDPAINQSVEKIIASKRVVVKKALPSELSKFQDTNINYIIFLFQRTFLSQNPTASIIELSTFAKDKNSKFVVIDIHTRQINFDVSQTTFQLLTQAFGPLSLFRYIVTKDIFDHQTPDALFELEKKIQQISTTGKINVSSKGENLLHPLNLKDLISATFKSLFLDRTAKQKLTVIGDSLKDLDLAYLIKDELEKHDKLLDIELQKKDISPSTSEINTSSQSRATLQWLPEDTNEHTLKNKISQLITQHSVPEAPLSTNSSTATSFDHTSSKPLDFQNHPKSSFLTFFKKQKEDLQSKLIRPIKSKLHRSNTPQISSQKTSLQTENLHQKEKKFIISIPLTLISISLFSLFAITSIYLFFLTLSFTQTKASIAHLSAGSSDKVTQSIDQAAQHLQSAENFASYVLPVYQTVLPKATSDIIGLSSLLRHTQSTIESLNQNYQLGNNLYHDLFTQSGTSTAADISLAIQSRLQTIHQELSQIEIISQNHTFSPFLNRQLENIDFFSTINTLRNQTAQSLKLLESFSVVLKKPNPQYFAVLIQDQNELKSSGGTIRAIILAHISQGKILNLRLLSPGEIDSQMVGEISASSTIAALTGFPQLSFTNINTKASFPETSLQISKFLQNSVNFTPDFIIALTAETLENVLKEIGPINTSTQVMTSDSFSQQLLDQSLSHTPSKAVIPLLEQLVEGAQTQTLPLISFVRPLITSLNKDNLRIWFKNPSQENSIINQSFAGYLSSSSCHPLLTTTTCFQDTVYLAENNLSVAPLNFYQHRQLQYQSTIDTKSIIHTITLNYQYSQDLPNVNRDYSALYQVYLHPQAQFISLERDGQVIDSSITKETSGDLSLFEIPLSHSPLDSHLVKMKFTVPITPSNLTSSDFAYSLKTYHQPGTSLQDTQIIINHPTSLSASSLTSSATIGQGKITYQPLSSSSSNYIFGVQFASEAKVM
jgi:hypothetical protein